MVSTAAHSNNTHPLDEQAWRAVCETAAEKAFKGCGLSHGYYVDLFSLEIDEQIGQLPEFQHAWALQIAQEWEYATPIQRQETQDWNAENGVCTHGITLGCCTAGCGS